jgi:hypothetical protein
LYKKTKSHGSEGGEHEDAPLAGEASDTGEARRQFEVEAVGKYTQPWIGLSVAALTSSSVNTFLVRCGGFEYHSGAVVL